MNSHIPSATELQMDKSREVNFHTNRRWVEFQIIASDGSGEFAEERVSTAFIDVNTIESFYQANRGVHIEMESGNGFLVDNDLDYVRGVVNGPA